MAAADVDFVNVRTASLQRGPVGLGLEIQTPPNDKYPFVARLMPDGAAAAAGFILTGDVIVAINETVLKGLDHAEVVALLSPDQVMLRVGQYKLPEGQRRLELPLNTNKDLGIKLATSAEGQGNAVPSVEALVPGGLAEADGSLLVGDFVLRINGQPMAGASSEAMVAALQRDADRLVLVVHTPPQNRPEAEPVAARSAEPAPVEEEEGRVVTLDASKTRLGIRIVTDDSAGVTQILEVIPGGAAAHSGQVYPGDLIRKVNGTALSNKTHEQVLGLLSQGSIVKLALEDGQLPAVASEPVATLTAPEGVTMPEGEQITVQLDKAAGDGSLGLRVETSEDGISSISGVNQYGAAQVDGRLRVHDILASVDGVNLLGGSHEQLVQVLGGSPNPKIVVIRPPTKDLFGRPIFRVTLTRVNYESWGVRIIALRGGLGVAVTGTVPDTPAGRCPGIMENDVITAVRVVCFCLVSTLTGLPCIDRPTKRVERRASPSGQPLVALHFGGARGNASHLGARGHSRCFARPAGHPYCQRRGANCRPCPRF